MFRIGQYIYIILASRIIVEGEVHVLDWTVSTRINEFGNSLELFCKVKDCCTKEFGGWEKWTANTTETIIMFGTEYLIYGNTQKYGFRVETEGFYLTIKNVEENDLNKYYTCSYKLSMSPKKLLTRTDAFIGSKEKASNEDHRTYVYLMIGVVFGVVVLLTCVYFWKIRFNDRFTLMNRLTETADENQDTADSHTGLECTHL